MSKIKEKFLLNIAFPLADLMMGTNAMKWHRQIKRMNAWSSAEIEKWQFDKLQTLLNQAYFHTVYYREVFDNLGLKPSDIKTFDDLKQLPILTKDIIRARFNDLVPDNQKNFKHRLASTGGSTGTPFKYVIDENTWGYTTANKIFSFRQTPYRFGDMYISIGSASLFPVNKKSFVHEIYHRLRNTIPLNGMNMDDETCEKFLQIIKKYKVKYIYGYSSAIYLLASYCRKNGYNIKMNAIFTTSEKLTDEYREVIENTWKTKVMNCYGARDGGLTCYEINSGSFNIGYNSFCETKEGRAGEASEILCTDLLSMAFPLIRYQVVDEVILSKDKVKYNGQMISELIGRTSDIIRFANGHQLTSAGFTIMFRAFPVKAYRIIKKDDYTLKIEIQKLENYTDDEEALIIQTMKKHAGEDINIEIEYKDEFQPLANGKRSFFMNEK
jgi:phenylacetate-CoA ligase